ncbi:MAG: HlyD family efflux transporter periplasmic adaptor subunit [Chromatiales bacterium]|jgi:HlyD family secretion protein
MKRRSYLWLPLSATLALVVAGAVWLWLPGDREASSGIAAAVAQLQRLIGGEDLPAGLVSSNGRIEAVEVDVATKLPGRLIEVTPREGDRVEAGQVVARIDTASLEARLRLAEAERRRAREGLTGARALVEQRESELAFARTELTRVRKLVGQGHVSEEQVDRTRTQLESASAALDGARAQVAEAQAAIEAADAQVDSIRVDIADSTLRAPRRGRVLYRLSEPGEVLGAGQKVLTLLDLTDVYMVLFLPERLAGRLAIGAEARIVLDAAPELVFPATLSFVAPRAQFTPKQVETRTEREKLVFRVKARLDPELLGRHEAYVKAGLPGIGYVRIDPAVEWPERLRIELP